jgi:hypothetical protein
MKVDAKSNWTEDWPEIGTLESSDRGVTTMYAKELADGWHYAIVWWHYHSPSVLMELTNGKVIFGEAES